ncbi:hypothetical protein BDW62DRAFT_204453 [Aspergillus aurantiobrunneus]
MLVDLLESAGLVNTALDDMDPGYLASGSGASEIQHVFFHPVHVRTRPFQSYFADLDRYRSKTSELRRGVPRTSRRTYRSWKRGNDPTNSNGDTQVLARGLSACSGPPGAGGGGWRRFHHAGQNRHGRANDTQSPLEECDGQRSNSQRQSRESSQQDDSAMITTTTKEHGAHQGSKQADDEVSVQSALVQFLCRFSHSHRTLRVQEGFQDRTMPRDATRFLTSASKAVLPTPLAPTSPQVITDSSTHQASIILLFSHYNPSFSMSCVITSLWKSAKGLFGTRASSVDESAASIDEHNAVRQACRKHLLELFKDLRSERIDPAAAAELCFMLGDLPTTPKDTTASDKDSTLFYEPMPTSRVKSYHPDIRDKSTAQEVSRVERLWGDLDRDDGDSAELVHFLLMHEFSLFERLQPNGDPVGSFHILAGWKRCNCDDDFLLGRYWSFGNITDRPIDPWTTEIQTACTALSTNRVVLRSEILAILGILLTRLAVDRQHWVIPAMAVCCFNGFKARIVQGHMTENGLVLLKTGFYDFTTLEDCRRSVPACLGYMASKPIGDTKSLKFGIIGNVKEVE